MHLKILFSSVLRLAIFTTLVLGCIPRGADGASRRVCDNKNCKNPFEKGCLRAMAERDGLDFEKDFFNGIKGRVCNSDDNNDGSADSLCLKPDWDYFEIRISPAPWESAIILGWIFQIILSEVFGVPATIEGRDNAAAGEQDSKFSFYDSQSRFGYPNSQTSYPLQQLVEADTLRGICTETDKPCAHILTEVWQGGMNDAVPYQDDGIILQSAPNGYSGRLGFYVPLHTIQGDGSLASYDGFQGEENKYKLATMFKTPTNWTDYCNLISESNCAVDDGVAKRPPLTTKEGGSYFSEGSYTGHFRTTFQNNCTANVNCTGSAVSYQCEGTVFAESQLHWNNIHLALEGPEAPIGSYEYSHMIQIYEAANATRSNVFFWWFEPDVLFEKFSSKGVDTRMKRVDFPNPTMECVMYRNSQTKEKRCSLHKVDRLGITGEGACDYGLESLAKLFSRGIVNATYSSEEAIRSPAYAYLKDLAIPQFTMPAIYRAWQEPRSGVIDAEREGVCQWVYDNLDLLLKNKPDGYPKEFHHVKYTRLTSFGFVMGAVTLVAAIVTASLTYKWQNRREIKMAQTNVLYMVVLGHIFLSSAGIIGASEQTDVTCTMTQWLTRIGYTLSLVPILIKVSAINKLTAAARRLRRVEINRARFRNILASAISGVLIFLVLWTALDRPQRREDYRMDTDDKFSVKVHTGCSSKSRGWEQAAIGWELILLFSATIFTFQSRDVIEVLNESHWLAFMVYSHFVFIILRVVATQSMFMGVITSALSLRIISLLLSCDALVALMIYFGPKFYKVMTSRDTSFANGSSRSMVSGLNVPMTKDGRVPSLIRRRNDELQRSHLSSTTCSPANFSTSSCTNNCMTEIETENAETEKIITKETDTKRVMTSRDTGLADENRSNRRMISGLHVPMTKDGRVNIIHRTSNELRQFNLGSTTPTNISASTRTNYCVTEIETANAATEKILITKETDTKRVSFTDTSSKYVKEGMHMHKSNV